VTAALQAIVDLHRQQIWNIGRTQDHEVSRQQDQQTTCTTKQRVFIVHAVRSRRTLAQHRRILHNAGSFTEDAIFQNGRTLAQRFSILAQQKRSSVKIMQLSVRSTQHEESDRRSARLHDPVRNKQQQESRIDDPDTETAGTTLHHSRSSRSKGQIKNTKAGRHTVQITAKALTDKRS